MYVSVPPPPLRLPPHHTGVHFLASPRLGDETLQSVQNIAAEAAAAAACASLAPALRVREHQSAICMQRAGEVA
jgi:hypothetical protein